MERKELPISKKAIILITTLCVGILPIALTLMSLKASQPPNAKLSIEPPSIVYETLVKGQTFSINTTVANVTDLRSIEFKLSFNTVMLDVVGIAFLAEEHLPSGSCKVDDLSGTIWMNITYEGEPITTVNPVALASIKFKMMDCGESPLQFHDTTLVDSFGNSIPHETIDGLVVIMLHDIAIVDVVPSTNETYVGRIVNVTVVAKNFGDVAENFTVKIYHNDISFGTFDVKNLNSGANITIIFNWNTTDVAPSKTPYKVKVEAEAVPYEANLTNNVYFDGDVIIKIVGDVNGDGTVNIDDLVMWDSAFNSKSGDINWNPQADINGDGIVDKEDGMLIIQNYKSSL